jgi:hypothetical protein
MEELGSIPFIRDVAKKTDSTKYAMPALRFKTCRLLPGNAWNRELSLIQRRILRRLRNKRRSIKRNLSQRENLNSNIKLLILRSIVPRIPLILFLLLSFFLIYISLVGVETFESMGWRLGCSLSKEAFSRFLLRSGYGSSMTLIMAVGFALRVFFLATEGGLSMANSMMPHGAAECMEPGKEADRNEGPSGSGTAGPSRSAEKTSPAGNFVHTMDPADGGPGPSGSNPGASGPDAADATSYSTETVRQDLSSLNNTAKQKARTITINNAIEELKFESSSLEDRIELREIINKLRADPQGLESGRERLSQVILDYSEYYRGKYGSSLWEKK